MVEILPGSTGSQYPKDTIQHFPRRAPGSATPGLWDSLLLRNQRLDDGPLFIGQIHSAHPPHRKDQHYDQHYYIYQFMR